MIVRMKINEPWCNRELVVDLPLTIVEQTRLVKVLLYDKDFIWPSIRMSPMPSEELD